MAKIRGEGRHHNHTTWTAFHLNRCTQGILILKQGCKRWVFPTRGAFSYLVIAHAHCYSASQRVSSPNVQVGLHAPRLHYAAMVQEVIV